MHQTIEYQITAFKVTNIQEFQLDVKPLAAAANCANGGGVAKREELYSSLTDNVCIGNFILKLRKRYSTTTFRLQ